MNANDKVSKQMSDAIQMVNVILENCKAKNYKELSATSYNLTSHVLTHKNLQDSDLNKYFESSDVTVQLMKSINSLEGQAKRDVLRLLYVILQFNASLRETARQATYFQTFLQNHLDHMEVWENLIKYKHHINIASQLLIDRGKTDCIFNTASIRKHAIRYIVNIIKIRHLKNAEDFPSIIFYACSMFTGTFEDIPNNNDREPESEKILTKELAGFCLDYIRDYRDNFKVKFEVDRDGEKTLHIPYDVKIGFSFQQIANTVVYYSRQSATIRQNLITSGFYIPVRDILSLTGIPESILQCVLDIFKLPLIDGIKLMENDIIKSVSSKLQDQLQRETLSEKVKIEIRQLKSRYNNHDNDSLGTSPEVIVKREEIVEERSKLTLNSSNLSSTSLVFEKWSIFKVQEWLSENSLDCLGPNVPNLTGTGLAQLKSLIRQQNMMQVIDYLMEKLKISFDITLELIGALDKL